jgi:hypothetical protein
MSSPTGLERHPQVGRDRHHQRGRLLVDEAVAGPSSTRSEDQPVGTRRASERLSADPVTRCPHGNRLSWTHVDHVVSERVLEPAHRASRRGHGRDRGEVDHRLGSLGPGLVVAHSAAVLADPGQGAFHDPAAGMTWKPVRSSLLRPRCLETAPPCNENRGQEDVAEVLLRLLRRQAALVRRPSRSAPTPLAYFRNDSLVAGFRRGSLRECRHRATGTCERRRSGCPAGHRAAAAGSRGMSP